MEKASFSGNMLPENEAFSILWQHVAQNIKGCLGDGQVQKSTCVSKLAVIWTAELIERLIALFEAFPLLYDIKHDDYHNRDKKRQANEEIAAQLQISDERLGPFVKECSYPVKTLGFDSLCVF